MYSAAVTRTIVIIHPGGLGDVLLAVPALIRLRFRFPTHRLMLCAGDQVAKLLLACGIIDDWISVQGRACADLFAGADSGEGRLQAWLQDCDLAIGWLEDRDGTLSGRLKGAGAHEVVVRSPFASDLQATHQRDRFLEVIHEAPFEGEALLTVPDQLLQLGKRSLDAAGLSVGPVLVVIHPGSGSAHKCVAPEVLAAVAAAVQQAGATPVILEGPADRESVDRLMQLCANQSIVLQDVDLLTLAGVLAHAWLFVGQDSGVTHLAGLMGVRTVALFGPTDPARWAPSGASVTLLQGDPCRCQSWGDVRQCGEKPCLRVARDHLVAVCLAQLKEAVG